MNFLTRGLETIDPGEIICNQFAHDLLATDFVSASKDRIDKLLFEAVVEEVLIVDLVDVLLKLFSGHGRTFWLLTNFQALNGLELARFVVVKGDHILINHDCAELHNVLKNALQVLVARRYAALHVVLEQAVETARLFLNRSLAHDHAEQQQVLEAVGLL